MRYLIVLALLAGCASQEVLDPSGLTAADTARIIGWNTCIDAKSSVGAKIENKPENRIGTVTRIFGPSPRCTDPGHPVLAEVVYQ